MQSAASWHGRQAHASCSKAKSGGVAWHVASPRSCLAGLCPLAARRGVWAPARSRSSRMPYWGQLGEVSHATVRGGAAAIAQCAGLVGVCLFPCFWGCFWIVSHFCHTWLEACACVASCVWLPWACGMDPALASVCKSALKLKTRFDRLLLLLLLRYTPCLGFEANTHNCAGRCIPRVHALARLDKHTRSHSHAHTRTHTYTRASTFTHTHAHIDTHKNTYIQMHTYKYTYMSTHLRVNTRIYVRTCSLPAWSEWLCRLWTALRDHFVAQQVPHQAVLLPLYYSLVRQWPTLRLSKAVTNPATQKRP